MLQSFTPTHDWDCDSEPLLFDEEFCQILLKDLQMLPTPPQSPPTKTGLVKPWSKVDQLEFVSELLLEEFSWDRDVQGAGGSEEQRPHESEDCLWRFGGEKSAEEKLSAVLSTSPLLSDIDTNIFEEIAGSTLHCHDVALECRSLEDQDLFEDSGEQRESSSDSSAMSTASESSTSDSEDEIDVVTVKRPGAGLRAQQAEERARRRAIKRCHQEIQMQHNYAAPCPASPRRPEAAPLQQKRTRGEAHRQPFPAGRTRGSVARQAAETEDEEERRRTHNVMERQRRNELKNCFLRLRDHVPELSHNDKASKVVILKKARDSIRSLEAESQRLCARRDRLAQKQEQLRRRLEQLR
ncbi:myelocytomatosis oncogene homolog [Brienomyrus brachyistius]|uniref:myelocytomatosis oncogene homolog n=1 Tax=Brienomyrus brachyistius TaxID=42636 RepID=UPI0020B44D03|nr:myelocytomatosis oncogene homolog [Brienomyrus brachyistius]